MFIVELAILIYSVILHEVAHGFAAEKLGDPTARLAGRLTLDPRPHIDPIMTIALPLLLVLTHAGIIFGAAKPVPIDPFNFRDVKKDTAITALAGPATNLLLALAMSILIRIVYLVVVNDTAYSLLRDTLSTAVYWNVGLAIFNLVPIPPLDGAKVLAGILPNDLAEEIYRMERFGFLIIFFILLVFPNVLFGLLGPIVHNIRSVLLP